MATPAPVLPRAVPRPCSVFFQPRSRAGLRPSAARPLCGAWSAAGSQQKAAFRHSAVCAATATADATAETFQYQAEVSLFFAATEACISVPSRHRTALLVPCARLVHQALDDTAAAGRSTDSMCCAPSALCKRRSACGS